MKNDEIKDYFGITGDNALFAALDAYAVPWQSEAIASSLDLLYLGHSGEKKISPLIHMFVEDDALSSDNFAAIVKSVYDVYNKQWQRLWDIYQAEYNALNNYDLTESEGITTRSNSSESGHSSENGSTNDTETIESTANSTAGASAENDNSLYGFASTKKVSSDSNSQSSETTTDTTGSSTTTREGSTTGSGTYGKEFGGLDATTRNLTRTGNIGIRSNQELIQQEIELWKWSYFESVFNDIDKLLCLRVY